MTTATPSTESEWQLHRVLLRANLLQYYDTFVAQGGDDVQQLCEAGEEEFLEIMALVGMASKPLHVRRLQKALQEWVANPAAFEGENAVRDLPTHVSSLTAEASTSSASPWNTPQKSVSPVSMMPAQRSHELPPEILQGQMKRELSPGSACLNEEQVVALATSAAQLAKTLPAFEPKHLSLKKEINKQINEIMQVPVEFTEERLEIMRKYGAIYRRFDTDRVYCKPMSMHEVCVNEASAQLCLHMPNLLSRREDLFPLARQVVKESGYQYSKGHSRSVDFNPENPSKRQKIEQLLSDFRSESPQNTTASNAREIRQERLAAISKSLAKISQQQEKIVSELESAREGDDNEKVDLLQGQLESVTNAHLQLLTEQSELLRKQSAEVYNDLELSDKEDSNIGLSGSSSPCPTDVSESTGGSASLKNILSNSKLPKSSLNSLAFLSAFKPTPASMKNSLFDEGLRIAQQYGLGDFAQELKTLQGGAESDSEDQSENKTSQAPSDSSDSENSRPSVNDKSESNQLNNDDTETVATVKE
ncbi:NGFI-A-binding protein 1-like isoform X2 [Mya arenaria]|uniref:NGFI-A-binding protein 1-like isoform X2 n=1 Tax=Mya arenaria TaxID=6604 RepID=UPI0022E012FF|nr:NGFI-A-binding protein 1-like isoform X2 [Mya arenaria]